MDIAAGIEEYLATKENSWTHDTYKWNRSLLGSFLQWCDGQELTELSKLSAVHVQQFVSCNPQLSGNTRHHKAQVVKGFLRWCAEDDDMGVKEKIVKRIEMPVVEQPDIEIYSQEEIHRLLAACEKTRHRLRNRAILLLLLDTGVRAAELCYDSDRPEEQTGLLLENVVLGNKSAESYLIVMGKGRKVRTVKFGNETRLAVQKYINHERGRASSSSYLFLAQGEKPLSTSWLDGLLKSLGEMARVAHVHAHRFRHTFAIHQLLSGTSALVLMQLLGHSTLEATKIYTRALSQMQARQASISVVDEIWKGPKEARRTVIRDAIARRKEKQQ